MDELVTLAACPIGLFVSANGEVCLKTQYGNNEGRIDAYIVSTGEFFWGAHPQTVANQRQQMVRPFSIAAARRAGAAEERERCAKLVDAIAAEKDAELQSSRIRDAGLSAMSHAFEKVMAEEIASAIRALPDGD